MSEEQTSTSTDSPAGGVATAPPREAEGGRGPRGAVTLRLIEEGGDIPSLDENKREPIDFEESFRVAKAGEVVAGTIVHVDREGVMVDVGAKSEGVIPPGEWSRGRGRGRGGGGGGGGSPTAPPEAGASVDVFVLGYDQEDDQLILSKKRADFEKAWLRVIDAHETQETISAVVTDRVKGGLVVDLGIRGFVPASHVGSGRLRNLEQFVGEDIPLKVIEVDRDRRKVVLSNRLATEEEREAQRKETLAALVEGQVRKGIVRRLTDYGAFVDLGGVDGLLHISEMAWTRIQHPSDVLKVNDEINVMILKLNLEQGRISLGLRQTLPDPWEEITEQFHPGDVVEGTVTRLVPFGAFVRVEQGVEGIVPNVELSRRRVVQPEEVVSEGQQIWVKVVEVRPDERRMTLSLRQAVEEGYGEPESGDDTVTIGDVLGDLVSEDDREEELEVQDEEEA